jgi:hypothetical protein
MDLLYRLLTDRVILSLGKLAENFSPESGVSETITYQRTQEKTQQDMNRRSLKARIDHRSVTIDMLV